MKSVPSGLAIRASLGFDARTMTHRAASNRFRFVLLAALGVAVLAAPAVVTAQTKTKTATTPQAFATALKAARKQAEGLVKQSVDRAATAKKQLTDAQASLAKLQASEQTDAIKQQIADVKAQVEAMKDAVQKLDVIVQKTQEILPKFIAVQAEEACASESKGPKPKLGPVKRDADAIVGSAASEISKTREAEKTASSAKVKQARTAYANDVQTIAKLASALSTTVATLEAQAATLPPCP